MNTFMRGQNPNVNTDQIPWWMTSNQTQGTSLQNFQLPSTNMAQQVITPLPCRVIGSLNDIRPSEVPMDGTAAFFVLSDGSKIYAKQWNTFGNIETAEYNLAIPEQSSQGTEAQTIDISDLTRKVDEVLSILTSSKEASSSRKKKSESAQKEEIENA